MHQNNPQILIVEDEAITRNMLKKHLRSRRLSSI